MGRLYEKYHSSRNKQKSVIENSDFTYQYLLEILNSVNLKNKKILDIGCGVGTIDFYLASKGAEVLGVDISENGIKMANKNASNLNLKSNTKFKVMNFPNKVPEGKFDIIICSEILEHLTDDDLAVKKIKTLLNKNGIIIASSPSENSLLYRMGMLKKFDKEVGHLRRYSEKSYKELFTSAGFKVVKTKKNEGFIRNFLFTNDFGGQMLRVLNKWPFSKILTFVDDLTVPVLGESDILLVAKKS